MEEKRSDSTEGLPQLPSGYRYIRKLGEGGQGSVWLVMNGNVKEEGQYEAAKILDYTGKEQYKRFKREIEIMSTVFHPNIATLFYANPAKFYFIMEYCPGGSLADRLGAKSIALQEGLSILVQIANGLATAHEKGLVHRDLKPQNILFTADNVAKICDFGLAKADFLEKGSLTGSRISLGTPHYMAPEQWEDTKHVDQKADIWSLGVIMYEILTGQHPYSGLAGVHLMQAVILSPIPLPSRVVKGISKRLESICMKALEKDPLKRYQSVAEFLQDLQEYIEKGDTQIRSTRSIPWWIWPAIFLFSGILVWMIRRLWMGH